MECGRLKNGWFQGVRAGESDRAVNMAAEDADHAAAEYNIPSNICKMMSGWSWAQCTLW